MKNKNIPGASIGVAGLAFIITAMALSIVSLTGADECSITVIGWVCYLNALGLVSLSIAITVLWLNWGVDNMSISAEALIKRFGNPIQLAQLERGWYKSLIAAPYKGGQVLFVWKEQDPRTMAFVFHPDKSCSGRFKKQ